MESRFINLKLTPESSEVLPWKDCSIFIPFLKALSAWELCNNCSISACFLLFIHVLLFFHLYQLSTATFFWKTGIQLENMPQKPLTCLCTGVNWIPHDCIVKTSCPTFSLHAGPLETYLHLNASTPELRNLNKSTLHGNRAACCIYTHSLGVGCILSANWYSVQTGHLSVNLLLVYLFWLEKAFRANKRIHYFLLITACCLCQ